MARKLKFGLALLIGFLLIIVMLQNTESVTTRILSAEIEMPRALLLFVTLAGGYLLGYATAFWRGRKRHREDGDVEDELDAA